ncbi:MAG: universal stress protein, partial [Burkholderiaceae bacterium]|nr:universal stress protein [Burkholderiaceae bacterium]
MFTSILIPTDGSEKAVIAASKAVELAKEQGAKLTAVVVIDPFPYIGLGEASAFGLQAYLSEAQAMATQSLDGVRAMAEAAGVPFMAETIERSAIFEGILD